MKSLILWLLLSIPVGAAAQSTVAAQARDALAMMARATGQLEEAVTARDRVRALTETISAYEQGLSALRTGVRQAAVREAELATRVQSRDAEIAGLLAVLQRVGAQGSPVLLLHPGGPTGAARAAMLLAEIAPALNAEAADLRRDLEELQDLNRVQSDAAHRLEAGLTEVQDARSALNQAMAERRDLPKRFVTDPVREAILIASADTLERFAAGLDQMAAGEIAAAPIALVGQKGALPLPVQGVVLRRAGEQDAAGIARPGVIVATRPRALVTSPVAATIRYVGPLLDYGQVVILEPQADILFVLAGLETVYGNAGDVITQAAPLGLMGDGGQKSDTEFSTDGDDTGAGRTETLYIEVRQDNTPEDPSLWFRMHKDG